MDERPQSRLLSVPEIAYQVRTGNVPPIPATYHGISFRSKLEARYAMHLEDMGDEWVYEPRIYGPKGRRYLPDFQILSARHPTFIEVKPLVRQAAAAQRKMSIIWESEPDALLIVACEENGTTFSAYRGETWRKWHERWAA